MVYLFIKTDGVGIDSEIDMERVSFDCNTAFYCYVIPVIAVLNYVWSNNIGGVGFLGWSERTENKASIMPENWAFKIILFV